MHRPLGGSSSPHAFDKRFLGADPDGTSLDTVVAEVRADRQFDVLEWIYTFLTKRRFPNAAILTKGGSIYLSSALIAEFWDMHDPTKRGIKTREVTSSVAVLAPTQVKLSLVEPDGSSKVARYRKLETDKMIEWVGLNDADMESFIEGLKELEAKRLFKVT